MKYARQYQKQKEQNVSPIYSRQTILKTRGTNLDTQYDFEGQVYSKLISEIGVSEDGTHSQI